MENIIFGDFDSLVQNAIIQNSLNDTPPSRPTDKAYCESIPIIKVEDNKTCSLCLESLQSKEAYSLECGHVFCVSECIGDGLMQWLSENSTCPVCRFELPKTTRTAPIPPPPIRNPTPTPIRAPRLGAPRLGAPLLRAQRLGIPLLRAQRLNAPLRIPNISTRPQPITIPVSSLLGYFNLIDERNINDFDITDTEAEAEAETSSSSNIRLIDIVTPPSIPRCRYCETINVELSPQAYAFANRFDVCPSYAQYLLNICNNDTDEVMRLL